MINPVVSVIVPVYNVENYLSECIESIIKQSLKDIEIILVNDGSTDNSFEICNKYAELDNRIIVIDKKNEGSASSRNSGIDIAKGKYISFVDADDVISQFIFEKLVNKAEETDAEMVVCNHFRKYESEIILQNKWMKEDLIFENKEDINILQKQLLIKGYKAKWPRFFFFGAPWARIFKREFIIENNILFPFNVRIMQDGIFNLYALEKTNKIVFLKEPLYYYRVFADSISNKINNKIITYLEATFREEQLFANRYKSEDIDFQMVLYVKITVNIYKALTRYFFTSENLSEHKFADIKKEIIFLLKREPYKTAFDRIDFKYLTLSEKAFVFAIKFKLYRLLYLMVKFFEMYKNKKNKF